MRLVNRKYLVLLALGAVMMSASFILKHYFTLTDFVDGLIRGVALGLMILSLIFSSREHRQKTTL